MMSDDVIDIDVPDRGRRKVNFQIAGVIYEFSIPKMYKLLDAVKDIQKAGGDQNMETFSKVESWLFEAMKPEDAKSLRSRLLDDDDSVDIEHLTAVFQELVRVASDRPSGNRRSDS
jgi:hypothetical protein